MGNLRMRLNCDVEVVYTLAVAAGGVPSKSSRSRASLCLGKKPTPRHMGAGRDELYLIVSTAKNVEGSKYKVRVSGMVKHSRVLKWFLLKGEKQRNKSVLKVCAAREGYNQIQRTCPRFVHKQGERHSACVVTPSRGKPVEGLRDARSGHCIELARKWWCEGKCYSL